MNDNQTWQLIHGDALKVLGSFAPNTFDAVITDPPYASGLSDKALSYFADGELLSDDAVVVLECDSADKKPEEIGKLVLRKRYTFSGVSFLVYIKRKENE